MRLSIKEYATPDLREKSWRVAYLQRGATYLLHALMDDGMTAHHTVKKAPGV